jgi:hypothetical protein
MFTSPRLDWPSGLYAAVDENERAQGQVIAQKIQVIKGSTKGLNVGVIATCESVYL